MLELFTERARRVVILASEQARSRQHGVVEPEHLLFGILRDGGGLAAGVLERLGVTPTTVQAEVERLLSEAPG
jgi:ATP-dependent Clp protease ATP-binding subunit ClpC